MVLVALQAGTDVFQVDVIVLCRFLEIVDDIFFGDAQLLCIVNQGLSFVFIDTAVVPIRVDAHALVLVSALRRHRNELVKGFLAALVAVFGVPFKALQYKVLECCRIVLFELGYLLVKNFSEGL